MYCHLGLSQATQSSVSVAIVSSTFPVCMHCESSSPSDANFLIFPLPCQQYLYHRHRIINIASSTSHQQHQQHSIIITPLTMLLESVLLVATLAISFSTANEPTDRPDLCSSIHDLCVMLSAYPFQVCDSIAKACPSCSDSNGTFRKTYHCIEDTLAPKHNLSAMGNREFHPSACTAVQDICYFFKGPQSSTCPKMYTNCTEWSSNYRTLKEFGDCFDFDPDAPEVIDPDTKSINSCWRGN